MDKNLGHCRGKGLTGPDSKDLGSICLEAIRKDAFEEGARKGFDAGVARGTECMACCFDHACEVTKVVHNGYVTIVYFGDGEFEKVTYDPSFGYAYDGEKAVMAALLKHLTGSRYLRALKKFEGRGEAIIAGSVPVAYSLEGKINISQHMVERLSDPAPAAADCHFTVDHAPDGTPVNLSDDELLLREIADMNDDSFRIADPEPAHFEDYGAAAPAPDDRDGSPQDGGFSILADSEG